MIPGKYFFCNYPLVDASSYGNLKFCRDSGADLKGVTCKWLKLPPFARLNKLQCIMNIFCNVMVTRDYVQKMSEGRIFE